MGGSPERGPTQNKLNYPIPPTPENHLGLKYIISLTQTWRTIKVLDPFAGKKARSVKS
jgi:hypothetical protein